MEGQYKITTGTLTQIEQTLQGNMQSWSVVDVKELVLQSNSTTGAIYACLFYRK